MSLQVPPHRPSKLTQTWPDAHWVCSSDPPTGLLATQDVMMKSYWPGISELRFLAWFHNLLTVLAFEHFRHLAFQLLQVQYGLYWAPFSIELQWHIGNQDIVNETIFSIQRLVQVLEKNTCWHIPLDRLVMSRSPLSDFDVPSGEELLPLECPPRQCFAQQCSTPFMPSVLFWIIQVYT